MEKTEVGIIVTDNLILPILCPVVFRLLICVAPQRTKHNYVSYCLFSGHLKSFIVSLDSHKKDLISFHMYILYIFVKTLKIYFFLYNS